MKVFATTSPDLLANVSVDSAVILRSNPFFTPDERAWQADLYVAARISRLGMAIGEKFASRYYDALTVIAHPLVNGCVADYEWSRDGAIIKGEDVVLNEISENFTISVTSDDINKQITISRSDIEASFAKVISSVSIFHTLKTGDLVAVAVDVSSLPMTPPATYDINLDNKKILKLKAR